VEAGDDGVKDMFERAQERVGEFSSEYLLVMTVDGEARVAASDPFWAASVLDQVQPALRKLCAKVKRAAREKAKAGGDK
jgi:hypothetical protein